MIPMSFAPMIKYREAAVLSDGCASLITVKTFDLRSGGYSQVVPMGDNGDQPFLFGE